MTIAVRSSPWGEETIDVIIHIVCVRVCVFHFGAAYLCSRFHRWRFVRIEAVDLGSRSACGYKLLFFFGRGIGFVMVTTVALLHPDPSTQSLLPLSPSLSAAGCGLFCLATSSPSLPHHLHHPNLLLTFESNTSIPSTQKKQS